MPCVAKSVNPFQVDMIIIHYNEHTQQAHDLSLQLPINPVLQLSSNVDSAQPFAPSHSDTETSFSFGRTSGQPHE